ncbi:TrmB family transcriptional regulator [Streptomyces sp. INA 01156]
MGEPCRAPADAGRATQALRHAAVALKGLSRSLETQAELLRPPTDGRHPEGGTGPSDSGFRYVHGLEEIGEAIQRELDRATSEILTAQPDGPRPGVVLAHALEAVRDRIASGVSMRTLYQHSTRFDEPTKEYVRTVTGFGAQIRTLAEFFDRLIIVDRKTVFIPANADRTTAIVVTEPAVVKFLTDMFERAWDRAEPYPFIPVRPPTPRRKSSRPYVMRSANSSSRDGPTGRSPAASDSACAPSSRTSPGSRTTTVPSTGSSSATSWV